MYNLIEHNYLKLLFVLSIILIIINIFLFVLGYYVCKWLYKKVHNEFFLIDKYTNYQREILKKYGNCSVNKIYLVKNNAEIFNYNFSNFFLRLADSKSKTFLQNNTFNHYAIICKLKINKEYKFILIEKNACLRIKPNFNIKENKILKSVKLEKTWKFKNILNYTKKRIGKKKFFYWNICENNCQHWVKEILITLGKYNEKNKKFILQDFKSLDIFPNSKLNIITIITNLVNLFY